MDFDEVIAKRRSARDFKRSFQFIIGRFVTCFIQSLWEKNTPEG